MLEVAEVEARHVVVPLVFIIHIPLEHARYAAAMEKEKDSHKENECDNLLSSHRCPII